MSEEKELTRGEQLRRALVYERKNGWDRLDAEEGAALEAYCTGYKQFLDAGKTERECVDRAIAQAEAAGFRAYVRGMELKPGDRIYQVNRDKAIMLAVMGRKGLEHGVNIGAAHIDSPRLDLKQNPLYESDELGFFKTHYYGGIKKYQWTAIPLSLHGKIVRKDGEEITVCIGEKEGEPQFTITDILPHLGKDQMAKTLGEAISGEDMNVLAGSLPLTDGEGEQLFKLNIMNILHQQYGIVESDLISAELEFVPAFKAVDIGFDRSMIGAYGHDDRVCAYPSMLAQINVANVERTSITLIVDKEEIGSVGATGMTSRFFENTVAEIMTLVGEDSPLALRRALARSRMLSSDVSAGFDPGYAGKFETKNAAFMGRGLCFNKYTGSRGKGGSNDADAEYVALIRDIMDEAGVDFQTCELGRVNAGGGGTIAYIMAKYGMNVIDSGVAVLSMHALWEVANKADIYEAYRGYKAFLERA